jgi:chromosome partitioning protein
MPRTLTLANQKGGVAKTTDTINLAGAFNEMGEDVLVVDLDPQGNLTDGVGLEGTYTEEPPSLYDAMIDPEGHALTDLTYAHEEFDVVPANIDMFNLASELTTAMRGHEALRRLLADVEGYDTVLVDSPPSLGILTDNALLGTENVVLPVLAEDTSIRALKLLSNQIDTLEQEFGVTIPERAIVVSRLEYPLDGEEQEMLAWFEDTYGDVLPIVEIRKRVAIKRAYNDGVSIFAHGADCDQEAAFLDLADVLTEVTG